MIAHTDNPARRLTRGRAVAGRASALLVAAFFALHGLAHLVGIKGIWGIGEEATNTATYLAGVDPQSSIYVVLGGVWLVAAVLFIVAAIGLVVRRSWWLPAAFAAAVVSLAMCILWVDAAVVGLVVNIVIIAGLAIWTIARRAGRVR